MASHVTYNLYTHTFLSTSYLEHEKKVVGDQAVIEYRWGPRAHVEIDKREMLIVLAEVRSDIIIE